MRGMLDQRKGSMKALDGMKRRWNIFVKFFPELAPTPQPDPGDMSL